jgi:hypothetical protein
MERKALKKCNSLQEINYQLMVYEFYPVAGKIVDACSVTGAVVGDGLSGNVLVCFRTVMISEAR